MIIIPAIDLQGGRVVRLRRGDPAAATLYGTDPAAMARRFERDGAELLHVVDLDAALGTGENRDSVRELCEEVGAKVQVGGGLRSVEAVDEVFALGATRAVLGTAAAWEPDLVRSCVDRHGERIVVAVDERDGRAMLRGWQEQGPPLTKLVPELTDAGAPRFLVTAIAVDGTLEGPDLDLYSYFATLTDRPVIASGGVRTVEDLRALAERGVEATIVGRALYEGTVQLADALDEVASITTRTTETGP